MGKDHSNKSVLRADLIRGRAALTAQQQAVAERAIAERALELGELAGARTVAAYVSIGSGPGTRALVGGVRGGGGGWGGWWGVGGWGGGGGGGCGGGGGRGGGGGGPRGGGGGGSGGGGGGVGGGGTGWGGVCAPPLPPRRKVGGEDF